MRHDIFHVFIIVFIFNCSMKSSDVFLIFSHWNFNACNSFYMKKILKRKQIAIIEQIFACGMVQQEVSSD